MKRIAVLAATLSGVAALTYAVMFVFAPLHGHCSSVLTEAGPSALSCRNVSWIEQELQDPAPRPFEFVLRPLVFLAVWTGVPVLAAVAVRRLGPRPAAAVLLLAFLVESSSIISMGGGFVFALLCAPLLLIAFLATVVTAARRELRANEIVS